MRESKTGMKEFFIHNYLIFGIKGYLVLRTWSMNMISTWKIIPITYQENVSFDYARNLSQRASRSAPPITGMPYPRIHLRGASFHPPKLLELTSFKDESWDPYNLEMFLTEWLSSLDDIFRKRKKRSRKAWKEEETQRKSLHPRTRWRLEGEDLSRKGKEAGAPVEDLQDI